MSGNDVRCALAGAWQAVRARRVTHFPRVLQLLAALEAAAPTALRYRHRARLRLGLQAAVVMQMLREEQPQANVYDAIDRFFPEGEAPAGGYGQEELAVVESQESFRELVLELLQDPEQRETYLRVQAPQEYGPRFLSSIESLFHELVLRVESALPRPDLAQLQALVWSHAPSGTPRSDLPILRQYLADAGHAHCGSVPRPLPSKPRPRRRKLRPLHPPPLERDDVISDDEEWMLKRKPRFRPTPRRALMDVDGKRDRDRYRAHGQGGADQGASGREGGDPPPAAAPHLQRQADERREDGR